MPSISTCGTGLLLGRLCALTAAVFFYGLLNFFAAPIKAYITPREPGVQPDIGDLARMAALATYLTHILRSRGSDLDSRIYCAFEALELAIPMDEHGLTITLWSMRDYCRKAREEAVICITIVCRKLIKRVVTFVDGQADTQSAEFAADEKDLKDLMLSREKVVYYVLELIQKTNDDCKIA